MWVGTGLVELHVHASHSLKQKRGVIRSIVQRLRQRQNISIAEVGGQDTWQRAVLGISVVAHDEPAARRQLERAFSMIESFHLAEVRNTEIAVLNHPLSERDEYEWMEEALPWEED